MAAEPTTWRLDRQWAAPWRPGVAGAMARAARLGGNDASVHQLGRRARRLVEEAAAQLAALSASAGGSWVFCASRQEALVQAARALSRQPAGGAAPACLSREPAFDRAALVLGRAGQPVLRIDTRRPPPAGPAPAGAQLVALPAACPCCGDVDARLAWQAWAEGHGAPVLMDLAVAAGATLPQMPPGCPPPAAQVLASAALGGPQGVAALWARPGLALPPLWAGGGQQEGRRPGTAPVVLVAGFAAAAVACRAAGAPSAVGRDACEAAAAALGIGIPAAGRLRLGHLTRLSWPGVGPARLAAAARACGLAPQAVEGVPPAPPSAGRAAPGPAGDGGAALCLCWSWRAHAGTPLSWRRRLRRLQAALGGEQ